jgi:hypothetical protein
MSACVKNRPAVEQVEKWRAMRLPLAKVMFAGVVCSGLVAAAAYTPRVAAQSPSSAGASSAASAQANEKRELLQADTALERALAKGDKIATDQLLDADFAWTDSTGKTQTKAQVLQGIEAGKAPETIHVDNAPTEFLYGQVGVLEVNALRMHVLYVWVKRPAGWRELVYQEVESRDTPATVTPGAGKDCVNPCKTIAYEPKNDAERGVLAAYAALETSATTHDAASWGSHVGDEFTAASSNSDHLLDKATRKAELERQTMAGLAPTPIVSMRMFDFGDAVVMTSMHRPDRGNLLHVTRVWVKRDGNWLETASYQTGIQDGAAGK